MPKAAIDDAGSPAASGPFRPLHSGAASNSVTLAVTNTSQAATLADTIPAAGCQVRIVCFATSGNVAVHLRLDGAAATTGDMLMLPGAVEVFHLNNTGGITAILDSGTSGTSINVTLGYGV